jgi:Ca2+-binding EF-hand superfamily protein
MMTSISLSSISSQISSSIFSKIDTNNQGYIDKTQFSSISDDSDSSSSDEAFAALDSDSDGKLTKSELSKGIENLLSSLNSSAVQGQANGSRPPPPPDGGQPPPKPEDEDGDSDSDSGLTKDQMTKMASETKDSNLSGLLSKVSQNFDAADTNKDGKVTQQEAMAYAKSQDSSSSSTSTSTSSTSSSTSTSDVASKKVAELLAKYLA